MSVVAQLLVNAITLGLIYVLVSLGFNIVFGIMDVINFAHGMFVMWGGFLVFSLAVGAGLGFVPALVLATVTVGVGGLLIERGVLRRVVGRPAAGLVITLGLSIMMQNIALAVFGPDPRAVPLPVDGAVDVFGVVLPAQRLLVAGVALVALGLLYVFLMRTNAGRALRAVAQDPEAAALQGVDRNRMYALSFGLGTALAGLAGALMGPLLSVNLGMGDDPLLKAFVVVVIGGLGSISGTAAAGMLLGLLDSTTQYFVGAGAADLVAFGAMVVFLLVRPQGLFGSTEERS